MKKYIIVTLIMYLMLKQGHCMEETEDPQHPKLNFVGVNIPIPGGGVHHMSIAKFRMPEYVPDNPAWPEALKITSPQAMTGSEIITHYQSNRRLPGLISVHELDLTSMDFSQNIEIWRQVCASDKLVNLRNLNISGTDSDSFISTLLNNRFLNSLTFIRAEGTNLSKETGEKIRRLQSRDPFIRNQKKYSERYDCLVSEICVYAKDTPLSALSAEELTDLDIPVDTEARICYRTNRPADEVLKAQLKLSISVS